MNNQDKHITPWSDSDVQKYLKGELSAREMHQLEKAALEDPFLADALEGFIQHPAATQDLDELQARLNARVSKKNKSIAWMKMAAAILLLVGLGYTAWYILLDNRKSDLAAFAPRQKHQLSPTAVPPPANSATADSVAPSLASAATADTIAPQATAMAARPSPAKASPPKHKTKPAVPKTEVLANANVPKIAADSISFLNTRVASLDFKRLPANRMVYAGQVLDFNNRPLAGASLLVSGPSNAVTTTNALGQFKLRLRPQDTIQRLTVVMSGYMDASLTVNQLNSDQVTGNTIVLRERPAALNEVVVSGADRRAKEAFATAPFEDKTEKLDSFWVRVTPVTGRLAYLDYLSAAKKTLPVDTTIRGAEVLSFAIDPKGTPTDFKIEHSLSPAHDAGVIRLITDGARWKIVRGKNIRAMVSVSFP